MEPKIEPLAGGDSAGSSLVASRVLLYVAQPVSQTIYAIAIASIARYRNANVLRRELLVNGDMFPPSKTKTKTRTLVDPDQAGAMAETDNSMYTT